MGDEYDSSVDVSDIDASSDSSADYSVDTTSDDYSDSIDDFSEDTSSADYGEITDDIPDEITEDTYDDSTTDLADDSLDAPEDIKEDIFSENFEETTEDIPKDIFEDTEKEIVEDNQESTDDSFDDILEDTESDEAEIEASSDSTSEFEEDAEFEVTDEFTEEKPTDEFTEQEIEAVDRIDNNETTEELLDEEAESVEETTEMEHIDELAEKETKVVEETADTEAIDELTEQATDGIDKNVEVEISEEKIEGKELPLDNVITLNTDSNETSQQTASWRDNVKKANPIKAAVIATYMGTTLKANEAGYKTVRGYAAGIGGGLAIKAAGKLGHLSPDVEAGQADSVKSASHLYDAMYAAKHPEAVLNFKPSPVPKEIIDKNTLVLDGNPYASSMEMPDFSIETRPIERSIPGTPGVVNVKVNSEGKTVGNSSELSKNLWKSFEDIPLASYDSGDDLPQKAKGYQAQHIIPVEMHSHPVLQKIGMDMNDASNGMFLPEPNGDVHALTTHKGYHAVYNKVCEEYLDKIYEKHGEDASVDALEADVAKLQRGVKSVLEDGIPIYRRKANANQLDVGDRGGGSTEDLLRKAIDKKFKI